MAMIAESGLRYRGALRLAVDDATYALKVFGEEPSKGDHLIDLLYASLIVKSPYALLRRVPFKFVRDFIRGVHKFYFTWGSRD
jgi:hypothetical protein